MAFLIVTSCDFKIPPYYIGLFVFTSQRSLAPVRMGLCAVERDERLEFALKFIFISHL